MPFGLPVNVVMSRYFFNVIHGKDVYRDNVGQELVNMEDAVREARLVAGELVRDAAFANQSLDHVIEVSDRSGNIVICFRCSDLEVLRRG
jgi:hypothetical protein